MDEISAQRSTLITSELVLTELLSGAARPPLRQAAVQITDSLRTSSHSVVLSVGAENWAQAYDFFRARGDKGWSLVDCSSILICQQRGITRVLTHDHHFEQAGFEAMLR